MEKNLADTHTNEPDNESGDEMHDSSDNEMNSSEPEELDYDVIDQIISTTTVFTCELCQGNKEFYEKVCDSCLTNVCQGKDPDLFLQNKKRLDHHS